ncbi:MAG: hypothetical protein FWH22_00430, partial [Fibromonadales bacterium]|nr:hypothetical protein [Fibromonadales bacterium]
QGLQTCCGKFTWPASGDFAVRVKAECGSGPSYNARDDVECVLKIAEPPKPIITASADNRIRFTNATLVGTDSIFFAGQTPEFTNKVTISNNNDYPSPECEKDALDNGDVEWLGIGEWQGIGPVPKLDLPERIKVYAVVTCRGTKHRVDSAVARIVPDPLLSGTCSFGKNAISEGRSIQPAGLRLDYVYDRCGDGVVNGPLTTTSAFVYSTGGGASQPYPEDGKFSILGGADETKYSVKTNLPPSCLVDNQDCGEIAVRKAPTGCEANWDTYCGDFEWDEVQWGVIPHGGSVSKGCYFISDITGHIHGGDQASEWYKINGETKNGQTNANAFPAKKDGGYYIYISRTGWTRLEGGIVEPGRVPFCIDGIHELYCAIPPAAAAGTRVTPKVECKDGSTPENRTWQNAPANWNSNLPAYPAEYNGIKVNATCSGTPVSADCGNLKVWPVGTNMLNITSARVALKAAGEYVVSAVESCPNVRFGCSHRNGGSGCSIQVDSHNAVSGNNNESNIILTPKPTVGSVLTVSGTPGDDGNVIREIWCAEW